MKVLIVSNNAYMKGNGVCTAIVALRSRLINQGIDVRILACENPDKQGPQPEYPQGHFVFPIFEPIIRKSGFRYSKIDKRSIREAITWADVVHLMEGFPIEAVAAKIAKELGKPCVGTYHTFSGLLVKIVHKIGAVSVYWSKIVHKCGYLPAFFTCT